MQLEKLETAVRERMLIDRQGCTAHVRLTQIDISMSELFNVLYTPTVYLKKNNGFFSLFYAISICSADVAASFSRCSMFLETKSSLRCCTLNALPSQSNSILNFAASQRLSISGRFKSIRYMFNKVYTPFCLPMPPLSYSLRSLSSVI